jgi:alpha-tubulin suppressor-like RCC1 family protein
MASSALLAGCPDAYVSRAPALDARHEVAFDAADTATGPDVVACSAGTCASGTRCVAYGDPKPGESCRLCGGDGAFAPCPLGCDDAGGCRAIEQLVAGEHHTCASLSDGDVWCWGSLEDGVLGHGERSGVGPARPQRVVALADVSALCSGARHVCARHGRGRFDASAKLSCWGSNAYRQISGAVGSGPTATPVFVGDVSVAARLACGPWRTCVQQGGDAECWGLRLGEEAGEETAAPPSDLEPVWLDLPPATLRDLAVGASRGCAVLTVGGPAPGELVRKVTCWGDNTDGGLGVAGRDVSETPKEVPGTPEEPAILALGHGHQCLATEDGEVWCWGSSDVGQTGLGSYKPMGLPVQISAWLQEPAAGLCAGPNFTCALTASGRVLCWGDNSAGVLGTSASTFSSAPRQIALPAVTRLACGHRHACAADPAGAVWCWGDNAMGQLGQGTAGPGSPEPRRVLWTTGAP